MEQTLQNQSFKFQIMSDLHLEFPNTLEKMQTFEVHSTCLALLGDIGKILIINDIEQR